MKEEQTRYIETKMTRRGFLKLAGLAAAGLVTGYAAGKWKFGPVRRSLVLQAFLPENEDLIFELAQNFWRLTGGPGRLRLTSDQRWVQVLQAAAPQFSLSGGSSTVQISHLNQPVAADILLSDPHTSVFDPEAEFPASMTAFRQKISTLPANLGLNIGFSEQGWHTPGKVVAMVRGQNGLLERIPMERNYDDIQLDGPIGKTHLRLVDGQIWVQKSSCRHKLCQLSSRIGQPGERCACAPNRLMIEIEIG